MDALTRSADTLLADLIAVRALISEPERWCQGEFALDVAGEAVYGTEPDAVRWCVHGARQRVCGSLDKVGERNQEIYWFLNDHGVDGDFNDTHTHAEVIAALDALIAARQAGKESR